ncbi:MAG: IPExxxVDY family protein [Chlorobi bacterium]|nr:IPExxxVDY family protein [Chlorobiota bacterium]
MKKKIKLNSVFDFPKNFIGISSHFKDIQVVWTINNLIDFDFIKVEDFTLLNKKEKTIQSFSVFYFVDNKGLKHFLVSNKNQNTLLFPKIKNIDFILISQTPVEYLKKINSLLLHSKMITGAFLLPSDTIIAKTLSELFEE